MADVVKPSYPGSETEPRLIRLDSIDDCMQVPPADDEIVRIELSGAQLRELVGNMFSAPAQGSPDLWACTGCGSQKTIEQIKGEHPGALSCCPERRMAPLPSTNCGGGK